MAQQADEAFAQGMALYQQDRPREALDAFKKARLLSPTDDPRIEDMIQRLSAQLTPSPTPAPPTPTPRPTPEPVVPTTATPSPDLADAYFGKVFITVLPGKSGTPVPLARFSVQDHIGLYIEKLDERLHLPFKVRLFEMDSATVVADMPSETLRRFQGTFVWYQDGVEPVGHYRLELYAGDTLADVLAYEVTTEPVAIPTPVPTAAPTDVPATSVEQLSTIPPASTPVPRVVPPQVPPAAAAPAVPAPAAVVAPTPTARPTSVRTLTLSVSAGPSAIVVGSDPDHLYIADRSGLVWDLGQGDPALRQPFSVTGEPVGLAVDSASSRIYVVVRGESALLVLDASSGRMLASEPLPGLPGDLQLDSSAGWLHVVLVDRDAILSVDTHDLTDTRLVPGLPSVTGMALDGPNHLLYVSQLSGDLSVVDLQSSAISATLRLSDVGLSGVSLTADHDRVYAINTPGRELIALDPSAVTVQRTHLKHEPAAVVVGPNTSTVFVLASDSHTVTRLSPDGRDLGEIQLGNTGADDEPAPLQSDSLWARPRMAINSVDETVYAIEPQSGMVAFAGSGD